MKKNRFVRLGIWVFLFGVWIAAKIVLNLNEFVPMMIILFLLLLVLFSLWYMRVLDGRRIAILLFCLVLGIGRVKISMPGVEGKDIALYTGIKAVCVKGRVDSEADHRSTSQYLALAANEINLRGVNLAVKGRIKIKIAPFPEYYYGDQLQLCGTLLSPDSGINVDYAATLKKDGFQAMMISPQIVFLNAGFFDIWQGIYYLRESIKVLIMKIYSEPAGSLASGLLVGTRGEIPLSVIDSFNKTGLTHILAISGYNISLLITVFGGSLYALGRRWGAIIMVLVIIFFVVLTGASSSVLRAAYMAFVAIGARVSGRKSAAYHGLMISALLMILINPLVMVADYSFLLSFTATLGLVLISPLYFNYLNKFCGFKRYVLESIIVTGAAQVFTVPLIAYVFSRVSIISIISNLFFLPLVPPLMLFSALGLAGNFLFGPLNLLLIAITQLFSILMIEGVKLFAQIPLAFAEITGLSEWLVIFYYVLVTAIIIAFRRHKLGLSL